MESKGLRQNCSSDFVAIGRAHGGGLEKQLQWWWQVGQLSYEMPLGGPGLGTQPDSLSVAVERVVTAQCAVLCLLVQVVSVLSEDG